MTAGVQADMQAGVQPVIWQATIPRGELVNGYGWRAGVVIRTAMLFAMGLALTRLMDLPGWLGTWLPYGLAGLALFGGTRPLWDRPDAPIADYLLTEHALFLRNGAAPVHVVPLDQIARMEGFSHYITIYLTDGTKGSMQGIRDPQAMIARIRSARDTERLP
jgi:hypothetical protein